ncbi:CerR family C-terminal domain-containing protein [Verrucomicrobiaceae bacterium 227]
MPNSTTKPRRDGDATRERLLKAACSVFAEKGFRDATVQQICKAAEANPALISYHFGDKASLYEEVWRHCVERARLYYPVDGGATGETPAEQRLEAHIRTFVRCIADTGELSHLHRLNMLESAAPNEFIRDTIQELRQPHTEYLGQLLRELLGPNATPEEIALCEKSIIGQCRMARSGKGTRSPDLSTPLSAAETEALANHIVNFTLAGISALRRQISQRHSPAHPPSK